MSAEMLKAEINVARSLFFDAILRIEAEEERLKELRQRNAPDPAQQKLF